MFYVYVLKSKKDGKLYIGHTNNIVERLKEHNHGLVPSTKPRAPFVLLYFEASRVLADAVARERIFKTGFGRAYLKRRLSDIDI